MFVNLTGYCLRECRHLSPAILPFPKTQLIWHWLEKKMRLKATLEELAIACSSHHQLCQELHFLIDRHDASQLQYLRPECDLEYREIEKISDRICQLVLQKLQIEKQLEIVELLLCF